MQVLDLHWWFYYTKNESDKVWIGLNVGEIRDLDLIEQVGFDEFWNNYVPFRHKSQTLHNDKCETLHVPMFDLGSKSKCVIIPCNKLRTLYIDDSFKVVNLIEFWGIVSKL